MRRQKTGAEVTDVEAGLPGDSFFRASGAPVAAQPLGPFGFNTPERSFVSTQPASVVVGFE
jgi:hypothetical protein